MNEEEKYYYWFGKFISRFEVLIRNVRTQIELLKTHYNFIKLDLYRGESFDIDHYVIRCLVSEYNNTNLLLENYQSIFLILFPEKTSTRKLVKIFCKDVCDLAEVRNLLVHSTHWVGSNGTGGLSNSKAKFEEIELSDGVKIPSQINMSKNKKKLFEILGFYESGNLKQINHTHFENLYNHTESLNQKLIREIYYSWTNFENSYDITGKRKKITPKWLIHYLYSIIVYF